MSCQSGRLMNAAAQQALAPDAASRPQDHAHFDSRIRLQCFCDLPSAQVKRGRWAATTSYCISFRHRKGCTAVERHRVRALPRAAVSQSTTHPTGIVCWRGLRQLIVSCPVLSSAIACRRGQRAHWYAVSVISRRAIRAISGSVSLACPLLLDGCRRPTSACT